MPSRRACTCNADEVRLRTRARRAPRLQYQPIFLKEDITPDELAFIEAHKNEIPELETIHCAIRAMDSWPT